jgi:hypothetical protein
MLPTETLQASWTYGTRHRTIYYLAAFVHDLAFPVDPLQRKSRVMFSYFKYSIVNDLRLEAGGLHLDSTATRHTC